MAKPNIYYIYRMNTPEEIKKSIEHIVSQLERYGRAVVNDGKLTRILSRYLGETGLIYFPRDDTRRQSFVVLQPGFKLVRINSYKIRIQRD